MAKNTDDPPFKGGDTNHGRPPKRARFSPEDEREHSDTRRDSEPKLLPPELWSIVMEFVPYQDVLRSSAVSRTMLHDVMPSVKMLHIGHTSELHVAAANRFQNVQDVYIYCLLSVSHSLVFHDDVRDDTFTVDKDAAGRIAPFLCRLPNLERAFLGGLSSSGGACGYIPDRADRIENDEHMHRLVVALSGAFRCGALPQKLWISGLRCPRSGTTPPFRRMANVTCEFCIEACKSFPMEQVLDFECEGSSEYTYVAGESLCSVDVCLSRKDIRSIVANRPGGYDLLKSSRRFLQLLGRGTRHVIFPDDCNKAMYVVKYEEEEVQELMACIHNGFDVKKVKAQEVFDAVMRSFSEDERDPLPPRDQCYLAESAFQTLKRLGLPVDEADFLHNDEWDGTIGRPSKCTWRFY